MELLTNYYPLIAGFAPVFWVALATWMGIRYGARAVMMVNLPVPILLMQGMQANKYGMEVVQGNALRTLWSLPMVYTWTLCWLVVAPLVHKYLPDPPGSHRSAWLSSVGSVALAWVVNVWLLRPVLALVPEGPATQLPVIFAFIAIGSGIPIWLQRDEPPERADGSLTNYLLRYLSIMFLVHLGEYLAHTGELPFVRGILGVFPRLTFEMVVAVQAAHGFRAGRQVLVGLPIGLALPIGWCLVMIVGPELFSTQVTWAIAATWALLALGGAVAVAEWIERPRVSAD